MNRRGLYYFVLYWKKKEKKIEKGRYITQKKKNESRP